MSRAIVIAAPAIEGLIRGLREKDFRVVGPTPRDGAIVYDEIRSAAELPVGLTDKQEAGRYRLEKRGDRALFGYAVGPHSWKKYLFPASRRLWQAERRGKSLEFRPEPDDGVKYAFLGVRSCELHAIGIQDKVFTGGKYVDPHYARKRESLFLVAVNCAEAGGTCFCVSMGTGPRCGSGYDLVLTELLDGARHDLVIEAGTDAGLALLPALGGRDATPDDFEAIGKVVARTASRMGRALDASGVRDLLQRNLEHPRWADVASRCLSCANCTLACPTCFCSTVEDKTDLEGDHAERWRRWDSCFNVDFSYLHGGSVRPSTLSRYRQWMTHKLSTWHDQLGSSGCVGCGRCITWCPVGIDITEETAAIQKTDGLGEGATPAGKGASRVEP